MRRRLCEPRRPMGMASGACLIIGIACAAFACTWVIAAWVTWGVS